VVDSPEQIQYIREKAAQANGVHVYPVGAVSRGLRGEELTDADALKKAGAAALSDDGCNVDNANLMRDALIHAKRVELPILCHCEDTSMVEGGAVNEGSVSRQLWLEGRPAIAEELVVMRDAMLAEETGAHVHICHVSTARSVEISEEEQEYLKEVSLLTIKPVIYACNMGEDDFNAGIESNPFYKAVEEIAAAEGAETLPICAEMEAEIAQLDEDEKAMFLSDMGLEKSGLDRLIKKSYSLLGLISYLTAGKPEVRAWTIKKGTKAPQAAGKIHTDFERGFIRAEVVSFDDLVACGGMTAAKEKGLVRSEGKEYVMQDGDVVLFRFNV